MVRNTRKIEKYIHREKGKGSEKEEENERKRLGHVNVHHSVLS